MNKFLTSLFLGINSGLIYGMLGSTFTAYLNDAKIGLATIGFLTLRIMPYSFKYLWAPIVDSVRINVFPTNFGQRKSWIITAQCILIVLLTTLGFLNIKQHLLLVCTLAFITAFVAATYDIAMEAYRIELFHGDKSGQGNSLVILGFRVGLMLSGALGLYLASILEWKLVFIIIASFILPCIFIVYFSMDEKLIKKHYNHKNTKAWFKKNFLGSFITLFHTPKFYLIFFLIAFYKMSDGYLDAMLIPFLVNIGFSKAEIAEFSSTINIISSMFGVFVGMHLINRLGVAKILLYAELSAAATNLLFIILANVGHHLELLFFITAIESFCSGICNITLIHYMSMLCHKKFTATHYAILISISGFSRTLLASTSGVVVINLGWINFFIISALLSVPSIICILMLFTHLNKKLVN